MWLSACSESDTAWQIGGDKAQKSIVLLDNEMPLTIRVCLDKQGGSGYPITVVIDYDDNKYAGILEGQCMRFTARKTTVRFGTPSAFKYARGTYTIINN